MLPFFFFFFTDGVISVFEFFASLISFASSVPTAGDGATAAADGAYGAAAGQLRAASAAGIPGQLRRGHEPAAARADTEPRWQGLPGRMVIKLGVTDNNVLCEAVAEPTAYHFLFTPIDHNLIAGTT